MIPKNEEIRVEITNYCNYNCIFCKNDTLKRKKEYMALENFKFYIDKILRESDQYKYVAFTGIGDSLLNENIFDMTKYVVSKGLKPLLVTNGYYLTENCFKKLQSLGLHSVRISLHGSNKQEYSNISGVDKKGFNKIVNQINNILAIKNRTTKVLLSCSIVKNINDKSIEAWKSMWIDKVDLVEVWSAHNWADIFSFRKLQTDKKINCGRIFNGPLHVYVDGSLTACCFDVDGSLTIGDLNTQTLKEIFESNFYRYLKSKHTYGDFNGSDLICENCDQRNMDKSEALIYSSKYKDKKDRVNRTSTAYCSLESKK